INTTVMRPVAGAYTFTDWRDVLKVVFAGVSHTGDTDTGCSSEIRRTIVNNWSSFFQTACSGGTGTGACTTLQHVYRRDDGSGTTDVFSQLVGITPNPSAASNFATGVSGFCNRQQVSGVFPNGNITELYPSDYQDNDPIR